MDSNHSGIMPPNPQAGHSFLMGSSAPLTFDPTTVDLGYVHQHAFMGTDNAFHPLTSTADSSNAHNVPLGPDLIRRQPYYYSHSIYDEETTTGALQPAPPTSYWNLPPNHQFSPQWITVSPLFAMSSDQHQSSWSFDRCQPGSPMHHHHQVSLSIILIYLC